jgi:ABC-type branched-subunit amino acid transport system ATPase component/NAD(P)-dependent dehydrogenase (short-subunit alcohol dehydrogenase family)
MSDLLTLECVSAAYGRIQALSQISLVVPEGAIVALLGANGAGKTTTLNVISGLVPASGGRVLHRGHAIERRRPHEIVRAGIAQVPEGREVFRDMTVRENLDLGGHVRHDRAATHRDLERALDYFPLLRERLRQRAGTLSSDEQQMLLMARALMAGPSLLLLDEPSLGLSPLLVQQVFGIIRQINADGMTILLVEQNVAIALGCSSYAYILENGEMAHEGPSASLTPTAPSAKPISAPDRPLVRRPFAMTDTHIAIVTGAGSGIGRAIAHRLAEDGFHVVVVDMAEARAQEATASIIAAGGSAEAAALDLRDEDAVPALIAGLPRLDAVVNNAGIFDERLLMNLTAEDFRRHYEINLVAVFRMSRHAVTRLPRGGKIVNIASRAFLGARNHAHYVASKAAVVGLTRAMAMELAAKGILVNAVAPGLVDTPLLQALTPERLAAQLALQPTGAAGRPEDIANAVSFLASPRMDFITGQVLMVDGGKSLGGGMGL